MELLLILITLLIFMSFLLLLRCVFESVLLVIKHLTQNENHEIVKIY